MVLDNPDIFHVVVQQSDLVLNYDAESPQPLRSTLRLLCNSTRTALDGLAAAYRDCRRSRDNMLRIMPHKIAAQTSAAIATLGPLRRVQVEGLSDEALDQIMSAALTGHAGGALETLSLQRGMFTGESVTPLVERAREAGDAGEGPPLSAATGPFFY